MLALLIIIGLILGTRTKIHYQHDKNIPENTLSRVYLYLSSKTEKDRVALNVPVHHAERVQVLQGGHRAVRNARHVSLCQPEGGGAGNIY